MKRAESKIQWKTAKSALMLSLPLLLAGVSIAASVSATSSIIRGEYPEAISLTGQVTDATCASPAYKAPAPHDALCVRTCVELGADYALVAYNKIFVLKGHRSELYEHAGEMVQINGERIGRDTIMVKSVVPVLILEAARNRN